MNENFVFQFWMGNGLESECIILNKDEYFGISQSSLDHHQSLSGSHG